MVPVFREVYHFAGLYYALVRLLVWWERRDHLLKPRGHTLERVFYFGGFLVGWIKCPPFSSVKNLAETGGVVVEQNSRIFPSEGKVQNRIGTVVANRPIVVLQEIAEVQIQYVVWEEIPHLVRRIVHTEGGGSHFSYVIGECDLALDKLGSLGRGELIVVRESSIAAPSSSRVGLGWVGLGWVSLVVVCLVVSASPNAISSITQCDLECHIKFDLELFEQLLLEGGQLQAHQLLDGSVVF